MYPYPPFNPDQFTICYRAYAAALTEIQFSRGTTTQAPSDDVCLKVARRIIEASAHGERNSESLKYFGLLGSTQLQHRKT